MRPLTLIVLLTGVLLYGWNVALAQAPKSPLPTASSPLDANGCCTGMRGNANNDPGDGVNVADVARLIDGVYVSYTPFDCPDEANVNGDPSGIIDIADISWLVGFLYRSSPTPPPCDVTGSIMGTDNGSRDSIFLEVDPPSASGGNSQLVVRLFAYNDADAIAALSCGFHWTYDSIMTLDSAMLSPESDQVFDIIDFRYKRNNRTTSNADRQFLFAGATSRFNGLTASPSPHLLATYYFTLQGWTANSKVCFEVSEFNPGAAVQFVKLDNSVYRPRIAGRVTVHDQSHGTNAAPILNPISNQIASEHQPLSFPVNATDIDGDCLALSVEPLPWGATLLDSGNGAGVFSWTPGCAQAGNYILVFKVSDGASGDADSVFISVDEAVNCPPVLAPIGNKNVDEQQNLTFPVMASDSDGTRPYLGAVSLPPGASFVDSGDGSGVFSWRPSFDQAGNHTAVFEASDSLLSDTISVNISVVNVNRPPILSPINPQSAREGSNLTFLVSAADPDGDSLILTAASVPPGAAFVDSGNGRGVFSWTPGYLQAGTYFVAFLASDGFYSDRDSVRIDVQNTNLPPVVSAVGPQTFMDGKLSSVRIGASDPDGDSCIMFVPQDFLPPGAYYSANFDDHGNGSLDFTWRPLHQVGGPYTVLVIAADQYNLRDSTLLSVTVIADTTGTPYLAVSPSRMLFSYELQSGDFPPPQGVRVTGLDTVWARADNNGSIQFNKSFGSVPDSIRVSLDPSVDLLSPGWWVADFGIWNLDTLSPAFAEMEASINLYSGSTLLLRPDSLKFTHKLGSPPPPPQAVLLGGQPGSRWQATENSPFLDLSYSSGFVPESTLILADGSGLPPGSYRDSIRFLGGDSANPTIIQVRVSLDVNPADTLIVTPVSLAFFQTAGSPAPAPQFAILTGTPGTTWTATEQSSFIALNRSSGTVPDSVRVTVDGGSHDPGVYQDSVRFEGGSPQNPTIVFVKVTLTISSSSPLSVNPSFLGFLFQKGGAVPPPQKLIINGGQGEAWTLTKACPWLEADRSSGIIPDTILVSLVDPDSLSDGIYQGSININSGADNRAVSASLHVEPAVEVTSNITRAGTSDSIAIYISHDTISGFYIPLSYARTSPLFRMPQATKLRMDSVRITPFYDSLGTTVTIDTVTQTIVLQCPLRKPPIQPPDTGTRVTQLAVAYYSTDSSTPAQKVIIDTTTLDCPPFDSTNDAACGIRYYLTDSTIIVPQFQPGVIYITGGDIPDSLGQIVCDPDSVNFSDTGQTDTYLSLYHVGDEPLPFYITGLQCYTAEPSSGFTPAEITIKRNGCDVVETMQVNSDRSYTPLIIPVRPDSSVWQDSCALSAGWNLVGWNVDTRSDSIADVFGSVMDCVEVILGYSGGGQTYDPNLPDFSTLHNADHLGGYWVKLKSGCSRTLTLAGKWVPENTPLPLFKGWNLVSYLGDSMMPISDGLSGLGDNLIFAYGWSNGIRVYEPNAGGFNTLTELTPCHGYWILTGASDTLIYGEAAPVADASGIVRQGRLSLESAGEVSSLLPPAWVSVYGEHVTLDGALVERGAVITAHRVNQDVTLGKFTLARRGMLGFMPIYSVTDSGWTMAPGDEFYLKVNGIPTSQRFTWSDNGVRIAVGALTSFSSVSSDLPTRYSLGQNYPNPFNGSTIIEYEIPVATKVSVIAYNILGNRVATIDESERPAGRYQIPWQARTDGGDELASGVYIIRFTAGGHILSRKVLLLK